MYLTGSWGNPTVRPYLDAGTLGVLATPNVGNYRDPSWTWAADSGCFNRETYKGDDAYVAWLAAQDRTRCLFATAPDVVGDWDATAAFAVDWLPRLRGLGYPAAVVLQDGATVDTVPWDDCDWVFVGGTDGFKLGGCDALIVEAQRRGKRVHVGRVNSGRRYQRFAQMGIDSADGTYLAFGPDVLLPNVLSWVRKAQTHMTLWSVTA